MVNAVKPNIPMHATSTASNDEYFTRVLHLLYIETFKNIILEIIDKWHIRFYFLPGIFKKRYGFLDIIPGNSNQHYPVSPYWLHMENGGIYFIIQGTIMKILDNTNDS